MAELYTEARKFRRTRENSLWLAIMKSEQGMEFEDEFVHQREDMVRRQIEERGIRNYRLLEALRKLPRHRFVQPGDEGRGKKPF